MWHIKQILKGNISRPMCKLIERISSTGNSASFSLLSFYPTFFFHSYTPLWRKDSEAEWFFTILWGKFHTQRIILTIWRYKSCIILESFDKQFLGPNSLLANLAIAEGVLSPGKRKRKENTSLSFLVSWDVSSQQQLRSSSVLLQWRVLSEGQLAASPRQGKWPREHATNIFLTVCPLREVFFEAGEGGVSKARSLSSFAFLQKGRWEWGRLPRSDVLPGGIVGQSIVMLGCAFKLQPAKKKYLELGHGDDFSG